MTDVVKISKASKTKNFAKYFLVLMVVLFSSNSNVFFRSYYGPLIPFIFGGILYLSRGKRISKRATSIFVIFGFFIIAYFIKYWEFDKGFTLRFFLYIGTAFVVIANLGVRFIKIYEDIIYGFVIISLPIFFIQLINFNIIYAITSGVSSLLRLPLMYDQVSNGIIYTVLTNAPTRNCGFTWEPGPFASFITLAIICNLLRNNSEFKTTRFWVFVIGILTTQSTSGFISLFIITAFIIYNNSAIKQFFAFIFGIPFFVFTFYNVPFLKPKIDQILINKDVKMTKSIRSIKSGRSEKQSLGRFAGLQMNLKDFGKNPIFGMGGHGEDSYARKRGVKIASINGLGNWLSYFGLIGMILFFYSWLRSLKCLTNMYNVKGVWIIFSAILVLGFSFNLLQTSIFFSFMLFYYFLDQKESIPLQF